MLQAHDEVTLETGCYRLISTLGSSAYGVLWRAQNRLGHNVALKLINREQMIQAPASLQARWIDSAHKEIDFLRALAPWDQHHIVRLLDSGSHDGLPVMALELMHGDLARSRQQEGAIGDLTQILGWMGQINQALAKVHQYGWLYLDLKPANVLLSAAYHVKLADFGTSRLRRSGASVDYSGTASWQAPEQFFPAVDGSYATSERTDFFALGALFYYLVTGGLQLRFSQQCGQAYRDLQHAAAATLLARSGGLACVTLHADEADRFTAAFEDMHSAAHHGSHRAAARTWCPASRQGAAHPALKLLRSLLSADPGARAQHALDISRMLGDIRQAMRTGSPSRHFASPASAPAWSLT